MNNRRHLPLLLTICGVLVVMVGLVSYSPTLYRLFCAATGYGGTVNRAQASTGSSTDAPVDATQSKTVTVRFDANVAPGLEWNFKPEQHSVEAKIGEPTKAYYTATNRSDETIVAHATFNVTPYQVAPYFFKIQCFCFTEERLEPGESARMPLVFYLDQQMMKDEDAADVSTVTLSYTFFRQTDLTQEEIAAARDLAGGSDKLDQTLKSDASVGFANDAPRR
ncbi:cytochrome c oxidase assembly protein [Amorphus sp. 3PC139-8]|uniref:cytochrome c oxidase assembly protein n=1 Tax=Amorphus sp. 3PC139-8 TaxID=2735676 RepID=UPI00345D87C4